MTQNFVKFFSEYDKANTVDFSYSAVNTSKLNDFVIEFKVFTEELIRSYTDKKNEILTLRENFTKIDSGYIEYTDLNEMICCFKQLNFETENIQKKLDETIVNSFTTENLREKLFGLSINFPYTIELISYYVNDDERNQIPDFYIDTGWNNFLINFTK